MHRYHLGGESHRDVQVIEITHVVDVSSTSWNICVKECWHNLRGWRIDEQPDATEYSSSATLVSACRLLIKHKITNQITKVFPVSLSGYSDNWPIVDSLMFELVHGGCRYLPDGIWPCCHPKAPLEGRRCEAAPAAALPSCRHPGQPHSQRPQVDFDLVLWILASLTYRFPISILKSHWVHLST